MIVKTILLALLLTGFGLWAQTPSALPAPGAPAAATNRNELLRRALERAMAGDTNASAEAAASVPATNSAPADRVAAQPPPNLPTIPTATIPAPLAPVAQVPPSTNATVAAPPALAVPAIPALPTGGNAVPPPTRTAPNAAAAPAAATNAPAEGDQLIPPGLIDFTGGGGVDLNQVLRIYQELVGRTILRAPALPPAPNIYLKTQTDLTKKEAIQALEKVMALNGVAMIKVGDKFAVAVPWAQANSEGAAWNTNDATQLPDMGQYVTRIVQTTNAKPSELMLVLQPFSSLKIPNSIIPFDNSQILVLRDYTENIKRMLEMIKEIDVAVPAEFISEVIPIKYAKADDIATVLNSLSSGGGGVSMGTTRSGPSRTSGAMRGAGAGAPGYPGGVSGATGVPAAGMPSSTASFSDRLNSIIRRASASGDLQILGQTRIIADVRSNALLIFAMRQDMNMVKEIVAKLDVVLAQVLIETVILDVSLSDNYALGVSYLPGPNTAGKYYSGNMALNNVGFLQSGVFSAATNSAGTLGKGFSYFGHFGQDLDVTLTAIASDSSVKVIQRPSIMTSHATPASVFIGSTVPYVQASYYGSGYGGGPSSSYQQLRVGINLSVTPFINQEGLVVMQIDEAIDEISGSVAITGVGDVPTTTSRTLSAEVAVKDRETIVLGGFIRTSAQDNKSGMPILKDIPLIGPLFTSSSRNKGRNELMVLMRPTVLKTPELAAAQTVEEKRRLPGVRSAEAESQAYETERVKKVDEELGLGSHAGEAKPLKTGDKESGRDPQGFLPAVQHTPIPNSEEEP